MCEVCNDRFSNCPACCDSEPDNLEAPESEKNRPISVASQEEIEAINKLYINCKMTYSEAENIMCEIETRYGTELSRQLIRTYFKEYMVGLLEPDRILKSIKELIK